MDEMDSLKTELEHYKAEKDKIRDIVGQIGGKTGRRKQLVVNIVFLTLVIGAFAVDALRLIFEWNIHFLPSMMLLEIAVLLVSLKIIWMIHLQTKVDHFQFWILHSIEFQMNMLSRRTNELSGAIKSLEETTQRNNANGEMSTSKKS